MPLTDRSKAKEGGFQQVREALVSFEADVVEQDAKGNKTGFGLWGAGTNPDGSVKAPKEFLELVCVNVVPVEITEDLTMDISESWNFRINCSDFKGSFWVEAFLASADKNGIAVYEGLIGKRILFKRFTLEAFDRAGQPNPKFNSTNYVIEKVVIKDGGTAVPNVARPVASTATPASAPISQPVAQPAPAVATPPSDPMEDFLNMAVGKTEQQFRSSISLDPKFTSSPLFPLAKAGAITQTLVSEGRLKLVQEGTKQVYRKP